MNRRFIHSLLLPPALGFAAGALGGAVYEGRVVAVADGHTMTALVDNRRMEIRLAGIEAPVKGQRYAIASRQSLIAICGGEPVRIEVQGRAGDGVTVGRALCNGTDAGGEQVRRGLAMLARTHDASHRGLATLQAEARAAKRGVWSDPQTARTNE